MESFGIKALLGKEWGKYIKGCLKGDVRKAIEAAKRKNEVEKRYQEASKQYDSRWEELGDQVGKEGDETKIQSEQWIRDSENDIGQDQIISERRLKQEELEIIANINKTQTKMLETMEKMCRELSRLKRGDKI